MLWYKPTLFGEVLDILDIDGDIHYHVEDVEECDTLYFAHHYQAYVLGQRNT